MDKTTVLRARALIGERTPLQSDCGKLCGAACCQPDEDGQGGMYLFPGEETLLPGAGGDFAPIYTCAGTCAREERPLACRIFPLTPVKKENGWGVKMDVRARVCVISASQKLREGRNIRLLLRARAAPSLPAVKDIHLMPDFRHKPQGRKKPPPKGRRRIFAGWRVSYASWGAETGQVPAQAPQEMQVSASMTYLPSPSEIAETGHSSAHAPHAMQSSLI